MKVGIVCYASVGGSGIVATELAKALADRGHEVRLISSDPPFRFGDFHAGLVFHAVQTPGYPLFREPQYLLSLANKIVQVSREFGLDLVHAHYAIPHAAAAYLARQILAASGDGVAPRVITTLHGTDVTLIGSDESYSETAAFCIDQSDGVTAVSESLRQDTLRDLPVRAEIKVIPNFLDCRIHRRISDAALAARYRGADPATRIVMHVSNFRAVKRPEAVVEVFRRIRARVPARLLLVGDGPELAPACRLARELGLGSDIDPIGEQEQVVPLLSVADLFLLPSTEESFGLAGLEAMAVWGAGDRVAGRGTTGGDRRRRVGIPARAGRSRRDGCVGALVVDGSGPSRQDERGELADRARTILCGRDRPAIRSVLPRSAFT